MRFLGLTVLLVTACVAPDPCAAGALVERVQELDPASTTRVVSLDFESGSAQMPKSYFAKVTPNSRQYLNPNDPRWVVPEVVTLATPTRFDVTLPRPVEDGVRFRLGFPDRRDPMCPPQPRRDEYVLDVTIDRTAGRYFHWQELVLVGAN
ncbi:MAG: hypothetical protein GQE15_03985 [Archangiaceae bacterium]|nr:hypothetical protein [Archangiaceae bacterium]